MSAVPCDTNDVMSVTRLSVQSSRRPSTSADPLQFIKGHGAQELAQAAAVQMKVAAENKPPPPLTHVREDEDDNAWQAVSQSLGEIFRGNLGRIL